MTMTIFNKADKNQWKIVLNHNTQIICLFSIHLIVLFFLTCFNKFTESLSTWLCFHAEALAQGYSVKKVL